MSFNFLESVAESFSIVDFHEYGKMMLAVDARPLMLKNMDEARQVFSKPNLQLLYNQFMLRWFFSLPELTPFLWGEETPYNSIQFKDAFKNVKHTTYHYGGVTAEPSTVLYTKLDYYYHREAFKLLYSFKSYESHIVSMYTKYMRSDPFGLQDSLYRHVNDLSVFFLVKLPDAVRNGWFDSIASDMTKLSEDDKVYLQKLHNAFQPNKETYSTDIMYALSKIFKVTEGIIYE